MNNRLKYDVGLVTLFRNNYGSSLQCYALKKTIENEGYTCHVLEEKTNKKRRVIKLIRDKIRIVGFSILYRGYLREKIKMKRAMKTEKMLLNDTSKKKLDTFIIRELNPESYTWEQLVKIGSDNKYICFIAGSDQVWNASRNISNLFFLKFAPANKRKTYAVSFGVSSVPKWNLQLLKKGIEPFRAVSIREKSASEIINQYGKLYSVECDPTVLLEANDWKQFYKDSLDLTLLPESSYILVHFINQPSDLALKWITKISEEFRLQIVCFGYRYNNVLEINNSIFTDGDSRDYVALIDNADFVCTDSFHTSILSINLKKDFYVFERQYLHSFPQTGRISNLLADHNLEQRMITIEMNETCISRIDYSRVKSLEEERQMGKEYLRNMLQNSIGK